MVEVVLEEALVVLPAVVVGHGYTEVDVVDGLPPLGGFLAKQSDLLLPPVLLLLPQ